MSLNFKSDHVPADCDVIMAAMNAATPGVPIRPMSSCATSRPQVEEFPAAARAGTLARRA